MQIKPVYLLAPRPGATPDAAPSADPPAPNRRRFLGALATISAGVAVGWAGHGLARGANDDSPATPDDVKQDPRRSPDWDLTNAPIDELIERAEHVLVNYELRPSVRPLLRPALLRITDSVVLGEAPLDRDAARRKQLANSIHRIASRVDRGVVSTATIRVLEGLR